MPAANQLIDQANWKRFQRKLEEWLTPDLLNYIEDNWPSPEQIEINSRIRTQKQIAHRNRMATASAIATNYRVDQAPSRHSLNQNTQLNIL